MEERHQAVWDSIEARLDELEAGTFDIPEKKFRLLPQTRGSFFIIDMYAPDEDEPLPLVFNFHNLYLAGFQQDNCWHVFDDADLLGSGCEMPENAEYWSYLGFSGGYSGNTFTGLTLGITELESVYHTLIRYPDYKDGERSKVEKSCKRIMIMLCEAWRFPQWNDRVCEILLWFLSSTVDCQETTMFSDLFQCWSKINDRLLLGREDFNSVIPLPMFPEYGLMIPVVRVLLRPQLDPVVDADNGADEAADEEGAAADEEGQDVGDGAEEEGVLDLEDEGAISSDEEF